MSSQTKQPKPAPKAGTIAFVRVRVTGPIMDHSFVPMIPVSMLDESGTVLASGPVHPDALITPSEIRVKLLCKEGEQ